MQTTNCFEISSLRGFIHECQCFTIHYKWQLWNRDVGGKYDSDVSNCECINASFDYLFDNWNIT